MRKGPLGAFLMARIARRIHDKRVLRLIRETNPGAGSTRAQLLHQIAG